MKYIQLLLFALLATTFGSCSKDTTSSKISPEQKAFATKTAIGIYPSDSTPLVFDKVSQQLILTPAKNSIRIQNDNGDKYAELTLAAIPELNSRGGVSGTFKNNMGLKELQLESVVVIKQEDENLWLWCEDAQIGMILPWIQ